MKESDPREKAWRHDVDPWSMDLSNPSAVARTVEEGYGVLKVDTAGQAMLHPGVSFQPSLGYRPAGFWGDEMQGSNADDVKFATANWKLYLSEAKRTLPLVYTGNDVDVADDKSEPDRSATRLWNDVVRDEGGDDKRPSGVLLKRFTFHTIQRYSSGADASIFGQGQPACLASTRGAFKGMGVHDRSPTSFPFIPASTLPCSCPVMSFLSLLL